MKLGKRVLTAALLLSMLLSVWSQAYAASPGTFTAGQETAFAPLSETAAVVYEQHENGCAVTLDRDGEGVTMHVSAPSGDTLPAMESARLYIRTGVELKAHVPYRVRFTLSAAQAQPEYEVWFDGGETEGAYGSLAGRALEAGGTDHVRYVITPEGSSGELVLRLLLGRTTDNTLRFSDLQVEEVSEGSAAEPVVLADHLDYHAPGSVTMWTSDDSKATLTNGDGSATLTVTQPPANGAEVWKIKLLAATGLKPEAGKIYRFSADVDATAARDYEVCYNEGDTEKGYAVLYNQRFQVGTQSFERVIYIPSDKENAGELVFQLSLGKLLAGDAVTIRNIRVVEAVPHYQNVLPANFSFDSTGTAREIYNTSTGVTSVKGEVDTNIHWSGSSIVTKIGDYAGDLVLHNEDGTAEFTVNGGSRDPWHAMMHMDTGASLTAGNAYRVRFQIEADRDYSEYEVQYGTAVPNGWDNDKVYGALGGRSLTEGVPDTVEYAFTPDRDGGLVVSLQVGKTDGQRAKVTVSGMEIARLTEGEPDSENSATVTYPGGASLQSTEARDNGSFSVGSDGAYSGFLTVEEGEEDTAALTCTGGSAGVWQRKLFVDNVCRLSAGSAYEVRLQIQASEPTDYEICYNKDGNFDNREGFGVLYRQQANTDWRTVTYTVFPSEDGQLNLQFNLGKAAENAQIKVKDIEVCRLTARDAEGVWPEDRKNITATGDKIGELNVDSETESASLAVIGGVDLWHARLNFDTGADLEEGAVYCASFQIQAENAYANYEILYGTALDGVDNNKAYGGLYERSLAADTEETVTYQFQAKDNLLISLLLGAAGGSNNTVTVRDLTLARVDQPEGDSLATVRYPTAEEPEPGPAEEDSFSIGSTEEYSGTVTGDGYSVTLTCTGGSTDDVWKRKLFADGVGTLASQEGCEVSFDIRASAPTDYEVCYNKNENFGDGKEKGFGAQYGLHADDGWQTVTYTVPAADAESKLNLQFNLGKAAEGTEITVKNIRVYKIRFGAEPLASVDSLGSVWAETPDGLYEASLTRNPDSAVFHVTSVPETTGDAWKDYNARLLVRTGVTPEQGKAYRVRFDIAASKAQSTFHVQYKGLAENRDDGYGADFNFSLTGNGTRTITHLIPAQSVSRGELTLRILLGLIPYADGNTFTVSNVNVEEVTLGTIRTSIDRVDAAVTTVSETQAGYTGTVTTARDYASLNIQETPASGMEAWKSKLFVDTGVNVNGSETYLVTMDVSAEREMDFEVCYNRDGMEKGFDAVYGIHLAAGKAKTIQRLFTAETGGKLILQLSLGNVPAPNIVTVRNVQVQKVTLSDGGNALPAPLTFRAPSAVSFWAHGDYAAALSGSDSAISVNIQKAPAKGAEPWKIKLFLDTAAALQAGKFYRVAADLLAEKAQTVEICYNNGGVEMGYDSMGGIRLAAGEKKTVEKIIGVPADKSDTANLMLQVNLGNTTSPNTVAVSGVTVEEITVDYVDLLQKGFAYQTGKAVTSWTWSDYDAELVEKADRACLRITQVPASGAEVWKAKLFLKTGATLAPGKSYLVHADLKAAKAQNYEVCYNNEETEKGFDVLYSQFVPAGSPVSVDKKITVPSDMTDAGELILQFSLGGPEPNEFEVSGLTVQEMDFGGGGKQIPLGAVVNLIQSPGGAGTLEVTRTQISCQLRASAAQPEGSAVEVYGANLRAGERYTVSFRARADKAMEGRFLLRQGDTAAVVQSVQLSPDAQTYTFSTPQPLASGGAWDLVWQLGSAENQKLGPVSVELSDIAVQVPSETLTVTPGTQRVTVNGEEVQPAVYRINGSDYVKLRDLAVLLNGTDAHFVVRYNKVNRAVSITTGKEYTPVGGELSTGANLPGTCVRSPHNVEINGKGVSLKAYYMDRNNYYRLRDLSGLLGFTVAEDDTTAAIASPLTPENQEASHAYRYFFRPEIDGDSQPYVGDPMPYYENGTYYLYYLKEGGDSYNHSVYLTTTTDFVTYQEQENPVLGSSREDRQDSWIGTGSVVKVDGTYYLFYTGHAPSAAYAYGETLMVAKSSELTAFERVNGWEIRPPAELGQKNDFRDPQAYYDPQTQTISLTVTASQGGIARILKYTLDKNLQNPRYDGIIFTDPTGDYWNLECSDTFRMGDKWYLTYSGQEDTLWYAMADSRFGPYSDPIRMEGKVFYAAKHVEDGENTYMVGWARRSETASSTQEVSGWGGNLVVQQVKQQVDGTLALVPVQGIVSDLESAGAVTAQDRRVRSDAGYAYEQAFTCGETFMLRGAFTFTGDGAFGLAFDFNGKQDSRKLISLVPSEQKLRLSFNEGATPIAEAQAQLVPGETYAFTYIQDGSVGIFYVDGQSALVVRLYGVTGKSLSLFAENNDVRFTSLRQYTK